MNFKEKVKKRLEKLYTAKELYDEGIISFNSTQHKTVEREIEIINQLLENYGKENDK